MSNPTRANSKLNWLLDKLVNDNPAIHHAVLLSQDGLFLACSENMPQDDVEHLSAVASGLRSLSANGVAKRFHGGEVLQTLIEMENAWFFVSSAGDMAALAVLASAEVDAGVVAHEMAMIVRQVGEYLSATPRTEVTSVGHGKEF